MVGRPPSSFGSHRMTCREEPRPGGKEPAVESPSEQNGRAGRAARPHNRSSCRSAELHSHHRRTAPHMGRPVVMESLILGAAEPVLALDGAEGGEGARWGRREIAGMELGSDGRGSAWCGSCRIRESHGGWASPGRGLGLGGRPSRGRVVDAAGVGRGRGVRP